MVGVAVNVTLVPEQIAPEGLAEMLTLAGSVGFTVIVSVFELAGLPVAHKALDVMMQRILSPLTSVELV